MTIIYHLYDMVIQKSNGASKVAKTGENFGIFSQHRSFQVGIFLFL